MYENPAPIRFEGALSSFKESLDYKTPVKFSYMFVTGLMLEGLLPIAFGILFAVVLKDFDLNIKIFAVMLVASGSITGVIMGYWVGSIPVMSYYGVMVLSLGNTLFRLFRSKSVVVGSTEFFVNLVFALLCLAIMYLFLFYFTYVGAKLSRRIKGSGQKG
jgi:hypothetical protein